MPGSRSPEVIGRYAIHEKIASGGMASVHFGRLLGAAGFSRTVAIKRLHRHLAEDPDFLSTMIDEARLAARIHHPNVVPTLDVVAVDGELLVVMEYVRGESLSALVRAERARGRRIPLAMASAIVVGALHGLHAAHEATSDRGTPLGLVHRDVSPQNILVGVDGVARVIDFGVAKAAGRLQSTGEGIIKGKVAYMAPEQLAGREVSRRSDICAMAVVLWEVLTGERLFKSDGDGGVVVGLVLAGAKDPPSRHVADLPRGLDALVMKGLAPDPAARFATAREMADALMDIVPPAFPSQVGPWVEEVARENLEQRGAILADIESRSGATNVLLAALSDGAAEAARVRAQEAVTAPRGAPSAPELEPPTTASQASSLSVEAPRQSTLDVARGRRLGALTMAGLGALLLALVAVVAWRAGAATTARDAAASGGPPSAGALVATAPAAATSSEVPQATEPAPSASASTVVAVPPPTASPLPPTRPAPPAVRPRAPVVKPKTPILFARPD
jgi:serine/threonine-protein kinase